VGSVLLSYADNVPGHGVSTVLEGIAPPQTGNLSSGIKPVWEPAQDMNVLRVHAYVDNLDTQLLQALTHRQANNTALRRVQDNRGIPHLPLRALQLAIVHPLGRRVLVVIGHVLTVMTCPEPACVAV